MVAYKNIARPATAPTITAIPNTPCFSLLAAPFSVVMVEFLVLLLLTLVGAGTSEPCALVLVLSCDARGVGVQVHFGSKYPEGYKSARGVPEGAHVVAVCLGKSLAKV